MIYCGANPGEDFPFQDVTNEAERQIEQGAVTYQKFTCAGCGARLTIDIPNTFYTKGTCDKCGALTDIAERGCNYMAILLPKYMKPNDKSR
jgi:hypothetical protein